MKAGSALRMALAGLVAGIAVLPALAAPADAMIRDVSADYLARKAQTIVLARATALQSHRADASTDAAAGTSIVTDVRFRVFKVLKGDAAAAMTITIPGGRVGNVGLTCPDAPSFHKGVTYLVYLNGDGQIVAWHRGQPLVTGGRVPELGKTLGQIERRVAALTGREATEYAPAPVNVTSRSASAAVAGAPGLLLKPASSSSAAAAAGAASTSVDASSSTGRATPYISSIDPGAASAGTDSVVTVYGSGFGAAQGGYQVCFFYQADQYGNETYISAPIVSWSDTAIRCVVPTDIVDNYPASAGTGPVYVTDGYYSWSNGYPFTVTFSYGGQQWPRNKCKFRVNAGANTGWRDAIINAAATWNAQGSGFRFEYKGAAPNNVNMDDWNGYNDIVWGYLSQSTGIASAWTFDVGRAIVETDIVFNTTFLWDTFGSAAAMDVQTIAAHELGHWICLRDLYGDGDAGDIMYGFCTEGIVKRNPTGDDIAGIRWVYSAARMDTQRPVRSVAQRESVRRFRTAKLSMLVSDPDYSCGAANVRLVVTNRSGRTVARILGWAVPTNEWSYVTWRCKLPKGTYRWRVQATDMAGHKALKTGSNKLVVR